MNTEITDYKAEDTDRLLDFLRRARVLWFCVAGRSCAVGARCSSAAAFAWLPLQTPALRSEFRA